MPTPETKKKVRLLNRAEDAVLHPETDAQVVLFGEDSDVYAEITAIKSTLSGLGGDYVERSEIGQANGVAGLDASGKVPTSQLPSYVDDVVEYENEDAFPEEGEAGKIYVDTTTNKTYRWSGSQYVEISASLALGETASTAYAGDKGKANAEAIAALQSGKQDALVSGTNIKSVGTQSILGSGPLDLATLANDMGVATTEGLQSLTDRVTQAEGDIDAIQAKEAGWDAKYSKPEGGIPEADLAESVKGALAKANTALQSLDPDLTAIAALEGTSGLLKKTAADEWELDTTAYATAAALGALQGTVDGKADQTDLEALQGTVGTLQTTVGTKADQTALDDLEETVGTKADQSALTALQGTVATKADQSALTALQGKVDGLEYVTYEEIAEA